ncbi:thioredoxin family protein [Thermocrinis jamiesonii]|uniref:thioredoxin family protein n=1 Tax=Thermocrinis jamiesonii TaxID=1302351 RepID=UPI00049629D0|nr:thioredoxin family protein [Thermocrinis jamiesonii]
MWRVLYRVLVVLLVIFATAYSAPIPFLKPSFLNLKEDLEDSVREGKYLFIMFHQEGCPFCDKMRRITFQDKDVQNYYTKHFNMVEIDIRGSLEVVDFDGKKLTERQFALKHGVRLTPVFMFFDKKGEVIAKVPGYIEPKEFILIGRWIVEEHYKRTNLVNFLRENKK